MVLRYFILLLFCGCNNNFKADIEILQSKPITIPSNLMAFNFNSKKEVDSRNYKKIVIYYDSTDCSSCAVNRLFLWDNIISNLRHTEVQFYFIFRPLLRDVDLIKGIINTLNYSILIDINGEFEKLNPHLPKNRAFHTFLLDENNKVILVGNPLYNKEIEKLFYKITQEKLSK